MQSHWAMLHKPPMCLSCPQKSVRLEDLLRGLCCCPGRQIRLQPCPAGCLMLISAGWQVAGGAFWCGTQRQYTSIALLKRAAVASLVNVLEVEGIWCIASVCSILSRDCLYCLGLAYLNLSCDCMGLLPHPQVLCDSLMMFTLTGYGRASMLPSIEQPGLYCAPQSRLTCPSATSPPARL